MVNVMNSEGPTLFLCAGLQSSGSTLVSWCFLQRPDLDGILDGRNDLLLDLRPAWPARRLWCKTTIVSFRLWEQVQHYEDAGWNVRPLLVVRDVRSVFQSLLAKRYHVNGITAEEPPLRLRLRRFKEDWELFRARGWPMIRYESLVHEPEVVLKQACRQLGLAWHSSMLEWPKRGHELTFQGCGSRTFAQSRGQTLWDSVRPEMTGLCVGRIPVQDLHWLEYEFSEYNRVLSYVAHAETAAIGPVGRAVPTFRHTKLHRRLRRSHYLAWLCRSVPGLRFAWERVCRKSTGMCYSGRDDLRDNSASSPHYRPHAAAAEALR